MTTLRKLASVCTVATFVLIVIGGVVRATESGLGCSTDWPGCNGRLMPSLGNAEMMIELTHRVAAAIVGILIAALAALALRHLRNRPRILVPSLAAVGLVLFQAWLGRFVVVEELQPWLVALHLGTALLLLGLLVYVTLALRALDTTSPGAADAKASRASVAAAGALLVLLVLGSYLSGVGDARGAGFPEWPLIDGEFFPNLRSEVIALHWLHRALALVVGAIVLAVTIPVMRRKSRLPTAAKLAHSVAGLYVVQIVVGAANVWTQSREGLLATSVSVHLALAALIWAGLVGLAVVTHPAVVEEKTTVEARRSAPVLEV